MRRAETAAAGAAFVWAAGKARTGAVSNTERSVFEAFNTAPDQLELPVWAVMQAGSLAAVLATAAATNARRGQHEAAVVLVTGTAVWAGVKIIKPLIGRGRPARHLPHVTVRGQPQSGLGFPSGHAAVSLTLALTTTRSGPARRLALAAAAITGGARMYVGAHLPLDVVGGLAVGTLAGAAAEALR